MLGGIVLFVASAVMLVLYVWSIAWAYGDAEARGKPGCLGVLLGWSLPGRLGLIP